MKLCVKWRQEFGFAVETPNYKHKITNEFQWSKFEREEKRFGQLKFGTYLGFAIWHLEFQRYLAPATPA
jgi:hypothetical protein